VAKWGGSIHKSTLVRTLKSISIGNCVQQRHQNVAKISHRFSESIWRYWLSGFCSGSECDKANETDGGLPLAPVNYTAEVPKAANVTGCENVMYPPPSGLSRRGDDWPATTSKLGIFLNAYVSDAPCRLTVT
jgi:hypothetical protein